MDSVFLLSGITLLSGLINVLIQLSGGLGMNDYNDKSQYYVLK